MAHSLPNEKDRGLQARGLLSLVLCPASLVQAHQRVYFRLVRNQRQEAEQGKQTNQKNHENHHKNGHDNLLSRVENGY
jgi:hypothetical protein